MAPDHRNETAAAAPRPPGGTGTPRADRSPSADELLWHAHKAAEQLDNTLVSTAEQLREEPEGAALPTQVRRDLAEQAADLATALAPLLAAPADGGPWQHGDVVLDHYRLIWTRASDQDAAQGRPWARGVGTGPAAGRAVQAKGDSAEDDPAPPLTLLARTGPLARA